MRRLLLSAALLLAPTAPAAAQPVLMISIDGLRPGDVTDADKRGLKLPNLRAVMAGGAWASGVRNMLPTVTYPNHTTLITGAAPAVHGISNNVVFDPLQKNLEGWYWYAADIKVGTLWDAVHKAGGKTASLGWPVSVGTRSIDFDIPEYWRAWTPEDLKLIRALSTDGLLDALARDSGLPAAQLPGTEPENDATRAAYTAALLARERPQFTTLHLAALDHYEHKFGPGSPEANAILEETDATVGSLVAAARKAEPDLVVAIVSDHGFAPVQHDVNLIAAFIDAGLVTLDPATHKVAGWEASPWTAGGSAAVVLARPDDAALKAKVAALLARLAADPANGIAAVIDAPAIAALGGGTEPSFWVDFHPGWEAANRPGAALLLPGSNKGTHGYFPAHPEMRATFLIDGPGLAKTGALGEIDMRDIAPTLAKILGVALPQATGRPLF
ncbi:MAG: ectonucleotide pyrophosphatase/phosphodiesterase [Rhizomicrobium sp.]